jgi:hypothetical protein
MMTDIKIAPAAAGAFVGQDAVEQAGSMILGDGLIVGDSLRIHIIIDLDYSTKVLVCKGSMVVLIRA